MRRLGQVIAALLPLLTSCSLLLQPLEGDGGRDADVEVGADADAREDADLQDADADEEQGLDGDVDVDAEAEGDAEVVGDADAEADAEVESACGPSGCADDDPCSFNQCLEEDGRCEHGAVERALLRVGAIRDGAAELEVDLGGPGLNVEHLTCWSSRDARALIEHDFDNGSFAPFLPHGTVTVEPAADVRGDGSGMGARLCGTNAWVTMSRISTAGLSSRRLALRLALRASDLVEDEYLVVAWSPRPGEGWRLATLAGDGTAEEGWEQVSLLLPDDALDAEGFQLIVWRRGGEGCADVDDLRLVELSPSISSTTRFEATFDRGLLDPFVEVVAEDDDVDIVDLHAGRRLRLLDNEGSFVSAAVDVASVASDEEIELSWRWRETDDDLGYGDLVVVEYSLDEGARWHRLAAAGNGLEIPAEFQRYGATFPLALRGRSPLIIRWLAPESASNSETEGVLLDDVVVSFERTVRVDSVGAFFDAGDGTYGAVMTTSTPGERRVTCAWVCGERVLVTNEVRLSLR